MKKLLLSSVIMLGVCGIAAAQTDSKVKTTQKSSFTPAASSVPQKSTMAASDALVAEDGTVATPVAAKTAAPSTKAEAVAESVKTDDMLTPAEEAKLRAEKLAKANEAPKKIGKKQN